MKFSVTLLLKKMYLDPQGKVIHQTLEKWVSMILMK
jgi:phosphoribosylformylglycinamidine (FGAM) synthase PurS component